jgi:hypothetical protein
MGGPSLSERVFTDPKPSQHKREYQYYFDSSAISLLFNRPAFKPVQWVEILNTGYLTKHGHSLDLVQGHCSTVDNKNSKDTSIYIINLQVSNIELNLNV